MDDKYTSIIGVKQILLFFIPFHIFYTPLPSRSNPDSYRDGTGF
jgi:hypothetical protein